MLHKKKICIECKTPQFIFSNGRCKFCARKHQKPISKVRKKTGERDVFLEIWNERPHVCSNCQAPLGDEPKTFMFSHNKGKGAHDELRLVKSNIDLHCWDCHDARDCRGKDAYNARKNLFLKTLVYLIKFFTFVKYS